MLRLEVLLSTSVLTSIPAAVGCGVTLTSSSATSRIDAVSVIGVKRSKASCPVEVPAALLALLSTLVVDVAGVRQFVDSAPIGLGLSGATVAVVAFSGFFFVLLPDLAAVTTCVDMWQWYQTLLPSG
jgi:hypothetical protein